MAEIETPIWGYELADYMDIGDDGAPQWVEVTNLLNWEFSDDQTTYEPNYINVPTSPSFVLGSRASIDYEKDAYRNNVLDEWLIDHEDDNSIPVRIARVKTWKGAAPNHEAKMAAFALTPQQLDKNSSGEPIKLKGTLSKTGEWQQGEFNVSEPAFTEGSAGQTGSTGSTGSTGMTGDTGATGASLMNVKAV